MQFRKKQKLFFLFLLLVAVISTALFFDWQQFSQNANYGTVHPIKHMMSKRSAHTATRLANGTVLICGGMTEARGAEINTSSAELFNPSTEQFSATGNMHLQRAGHTATLLKDGNVLITGGFDSTGFLASAEIYNALTGTFQSISSVMSEKRTSHTATLLPDGKILLAGGINGSAVANRTMDIYDPARKVFYPANEMKSARTGHTATLLMNGKVLLAGGSSKWRTGVLNGCEIYDPISNTTMLTQPLHISRNKHVAVLLHNGKVLIAGGSKVAEEIGGRYNTAELFDPASNAFTLLENKMTRSRFKITNAADIVNDGNVVIAGDGKYVELFNAADGSFKTAKGTVKKAWMYPVVIAISNNKVLITGGYDEDMSTTDGAWIFEEKENNILAATSSILVSH